jgi:hypothetical protein
LSRFELLVVIGALNHLSCEAFSETDSVLGKRLKERVRNKAKLAEACAALERERNRARAGINWRFTTVDARIKLKRLYPTTELW